MSAKAIGIDLGTTHCCVAVYQNSKVNVLENDHGYRTTPSYVAFTEYERIIGNEAKSHSVVDPANVVFDSKRLIGRSFDDDCVQRDIQHSPFNVIEENGKPKIKVMYQNEEKCFIPEEISAIILEKLKEIAEDKIGETVTNAVITVPAYFTDSQRQATKDAARIAGLNVMRLINEPTAAAVAFAMNNRNEGMKNILVYDLGGGTFDVSILSVENKNIKVKAVSGDTHLGGSDFDSLLLDHFLDEIMSKFTRDLRTDEYRGAVLRLRSACEVVKKSLSARMQATISIDSLFDGRDFKSSITRAVFEELCGDLIVETLDSVQDALQEANLTKEDIDEVILVGGSTRIPKVRSVVQEFFDGKPLNRSINPDEAVAAGAAIQAALLAGEGDELIAGLNLKDVTALSYGTGILGELMSVIVPRSTPYPVTRTDTYFTVDDNQTEIDVDIYQGEREMISDNEYLGEFSLENLPARWAGDVSVDITIAIDEDGILHVSASETSTGVYNEIIITDVSGRLTDNEINEMIADANRMREADLQKKEWVLSKNRLQLLAYDLRRLVNDDYSSVRHSTDTKINVRSKADEALQWLSDNPSATKDLIDAKCDELEACKVSYHL